MAHGTASRERTVCNHCDLPYYSDRSACPYCETASLDTDSPSEPEAIEETTAEPTSGTSGDVERESLLGRLKRTLGM